MENIRQELERENNPIGFFECVTRKFLTQKNIKEILMTIADNIIAIKTDLDAVKIAVAAIPTTALPATVDLTAVTNALATANTGIAAIEAQLQPTPPTA